MKAQNAQKKLNDWLNGEAGDWLKGEMGAERLIKVKKAPLFQFYANDHLLVESNDSKGKFFAVPREDWYGYVNNNVEDSFYMRSSIRKINSWNDGDNVSLMVPSIGPFVGRSFLSYTWAVMQDVYDITNLVMDSDFSFLNWSDDNPWEVKG